MQFFQGKIVFLHDLYVKNEMVGEKNLLSPLCFCPRCASPHFLPKEVKGRRCEDCGFELFMNVSAATAALIVNERAELLVVRRAKEPAKGTLDLPGGFVDAGETGEAGVAREVEEETGLRVTHAAYLFSLPNSYAYSGLEIPTLDLFFECRVDDFTPLHAADDAAEVCWMLLDKIQVEDFGLLSIRRGLEVFLQQIHLKHTRI